MLSSGMTYSRTSLRGSPRAVPCLAVEGIASSKIAPLRVVSCRGKTLTLQLLLTHGELEFNYLKKRKNISKKCKDTEVFHVKKQNQHSNHL